MRLVMSALQSPTQEGLLATLLRRRILCSPSHRSHQFIHCIYTALDTACTYMHLLCNAP